MRPWDAAWELEPGAFAELAPVDEDDESRQSSCSSSSSGDSVSSDDHKLSNTRNNSVQRIPLSESTENQTNEPTEPEPLFNPLSSLDSDRDTCPSQAPPPPVRVPGTAKPILSLVWTAQSLEPNQRGRPRTKSVRYSHHTIFHQSKSPPQQGTRRVRRRLSLYSRPSTRLDSSIETRLRQATLGTFLASFRVSSVPD
ncbi:unnamed protein product [Echinostoma caproni]|uniref:Movement protein n=1 Tax=Echinostoma caproni TaxID=27848 RepID=A0A183AT20_9TREM|nr:unnamed protein product [Echinostoma caproni]